MKSVKCISLVVALLLVFSSLGCAGIPGLSSNVDVRFLFNDGTSDLYMVMSGKKGDKPFRPDINPVRRGYVFEGWYLDSGCKEEYKGAPSKSMSVYAKWTKGCFVSFICEGMDIKTEMVITGNKLNSSPPFSREGYELDGWYRDLRFSTLWDFAADTVKDDMNLYARWMKDGTLTVTFDAAGIEVAPLKGVMEDSLIDQPPEPKRAGYVFGGWFKDTALKVAWNFAKDKVKENMTLYAKWDPELTQLPTPDPLYKVTFETNGGSAVGAIKDVRKSATIHKPEEPVKPGFIFTGWFSDKNLSKPWDFTKDKVTGNITLYAGWTGAAKYSVTFFTNGGTDIAPYINVDGGATIEKPQDPVKTGFSFDGWFRDSEFTRPWNFASEKVNENINLFARWSGTNQQNPPDPATPSLWTVSFNSNGGSTVAPYVNVQTNAIINPPVEPARQGYVFGGWYTDSNFNRIWDFRNDRVVGNLTLYARWSETRITVRFETNGGTPQPLDIPLNAGETCGLPGDIVRPGYAFAGWFTAREGGSYVGAAYESYAPRASITLHAQWTAQVYQVTVKFNSNGGSPQYLDKTVNAGAGIELPASTVRPGMTLAGWFTQAQGGVKVGNGGDPYRPYENITLYAQWETAAITIRYDTGGGEPQPPDSVAPVGDRVTLPGNLVRPGFIFEGWYTAKTGGTRIGGAGDTFAPNTSGTLYAQWSEAPAPSQ